MFPYEEENLEEQIRSLRSKLRPVEILEVAAAKRLLRDALAGFEKLMEKLPPSDQNAALRLYLDRIKYFTFRFNLAVLKMTMKAEHCSFWSREEMQASLTRAKKDFEDLARLYKLL
jgi:hypothetical protein